MGGAVEVVSVCWNESQIHTDACNEMIIFVLFIIYTLFFMYKLLVELVRILQVVSLIL